MRAALIGAVLVAASGLSGCAPFLPRSDGASGKSFGDAVAEVAKDPNCGHTDRVSVTLGALPSGSLFLERNCPMPADKGLDAAAIAKMVKDAVAEALATRAGPAQ